MSTASEKTIVAINAGSSSIRAGVYAYTAKGLHCVRTVEAVGLGLTAPALVAGDGERTPLPDECTHREAFAHVLAYIRTHTAHIDACVHRVVHGGPHHSMPVVLTRDIVRELEVYVPLAPIHMPVQLALIDIALHTLSSVPQIACFDTAFHRTMPAVARATGLPRHLHALGVERYGFHGLAYASTLAQLQELYGTRVAHGRVVICHLGNGASVAALHLGRSVDTSMGLTPGSGLVMSTRSGDVDPGLFTYLATRAHMSLEEMTQMCMHEAGLLGMSGLSADMKTLIEHEGTNPYAKDAVQTFCYRVTKEIGASAAVLGGIDTLVFTGGIGEQAPRIRKRICATLGYLGVALDTKANSRNAAILAQKGSRTAVYIVHPHEDTVLASAAVALLYERA